DSRRVLAVRQSKHAESQPPHRRPCHRRVCYHHLRHCFRPGSGSARRQGLALNQRENSVSATRGLVMQNRKCLVLIEIGLERHPAGVNAPMKADRADVSLALREKGWAPCRVWFDGQTGEWVASVIYRAGAV